MIYLWSGFLIVVGCLLVEVDQSEKNPMRTARMGRFILGLGIGIIIGALAA
jgi:hypothetical protein